jgi:NADH dehydrogenase
VVVVGAGFTGIEAATEMPARLLDILGENAAIRVVIVERKAIASDKRSYCRLDKR